MKSIFLFLFIGNLVPAFSQPILQNLSGTAWQFKERGNTNWRPATVPGSIHTDLMAVKALPDPNFRDNEKWVQWVSNLDWEYKSEFSVLPDLSSKPKIDLVLKGLDTYADVFLNGEKILQSENMFLEHRLDVKKLLVSGNNELRILFRSPLKSALPALISNPQTLPAINDDMHMKTSPYTRKAGYHYGWDWGPRLVTSGIWRPLFLEGYDQARIENLFLETEKISKGKAFLAGTLELQNALPEGYVLQLKIGKTEKKILLPDSAKGKRFHRFEIEVANPELWWTNGLGKPFLYDVQAQVLKGGVLQDQKKFPFGIRTIEVVHEKDAGGKSFFFKLNGLPVFMKGANYIPQDNFLTRVGEDRYRKLLGSAKEANMNMLRVWGGGIYENDIFYHLCDSLGLMVWQDMMFACTMYPGTESFRNSVVNEVRQNVRRLRNHCSIALWCGNNENETGWLKRWMMGRIPYSKSDSAKVYGDHKVLFHSLIPSVLKEEDPGRFYTRSSPSANDDAIMPDKRGFGDIHDWNVWFGTGDYRTYANTVSRFHSEYGFQSFPAMETIRRFSEKQDWYEDSDVMDVHQKHPNGNSKIRRFASQFYPKPKDFEEFLYISQLQQAEAMKFAVETHRIRQPYCMGSLYWQLNDCWPAASWSSIDYYGRWKATQYFVKKANEPKRVVSRIQKDSVLVYVLNETKSDLPFKSVKIDWVDFSGKVLFSRKEAVSGKNVVAPLSVLKVGSSVAGNGTFDSTQTFLRVSVMDRDEKVILSNHQFFRLPKDLSLPKEGIQKSLVKTGNGYRLTLSGPFLHKNLMVGSTDPEISFSDNYMDILPGEPVVLEFSSVKEVRLEDLKFTCLNPSK
jgi:beta-mannosidase